MKAILGHMKPKEKKRKGNKKVESSNIPTKGMKKSRGRKNILKELHRLGEQIGNGGGCGRMKSQPSEPAVKARGFCCLSLAEFSRSYQ